MPTTFGVTWINDPRSLYYGIRQVRGTLIKGTRARNHINVMVSKASDAQGCDIRDEVAEVVKEALENKYGR